MLRFVAVVCVLLALYIVFRPASASSPAASPIEAKSPQPAQKKPVWDYASSTDEMNGKLGQWACTTSPDRGGAQLCFRRKGRALDAYVQLPDTMRGGQFFCYEDHCATKLKFDNKAAFSVQGNESGSGNTRLMFLPSAVQLLASTKHAKVLLIDAPMYSEGHQVLHFDVANLDF